MIVATVPPTLEDEDLLEMVRAGLIPATVVDLVAAPAGPHAARDA